MSAFKDSQQNITFVYSNFYHLYRKGKLQAEAQKELAKGLVLKSHSVTETPSVAEVRVVNSRQSEEIQRWSTQSSSKKDMASNLRSLRDARKRLNFLMSELDELLKRS